MKTVFLSCRRREAEYWARAWGFEPREWYHVSREEDVRGFYSRDSLPAFVCGSGRINKDVVKSLEIAGFTTFIDAHNLYHPHGDSRCALDLLEVERIEG